MLAVAEKLDRPWRARRYSPGNGRWTTQDPKGYLAGDSNYYRYVFNSPVTNKDTSGYGETGVIVGTILEGIIEGIGGAGVCMSKPKKPTAPTCQQVYEAAEKECHAKNVATPDRLWDCLQPALEAYNECLRLKNLGQ